MTRSVGFTDRSMFAPPASQHPHAPRDTAHELVVIRVVVDRVTASSILVHAEGDDRDNSAWLPHRLIEVGQGLVEYSLRHGGRAIPIKVPRWKLLEVGFTGAGEPRDPF